MSNEKDLDQMLRVIAVAALLTGMSTVGLGVADQWHAVSERYQAPVRPTLSIGGHRATVFQSMIGDLRR